MCYEDLHKSFKKGLRNGNWKKLRGMQKGLYRAAMAYAWTKKIIVNESLVKKLSALIERLRESSGARIFKKGLKKAVEMLQKSEENDVFAWAPQLKKWLKEPDYIFWLGTV